MKYRYQVACFEGTFPSVWSVRGAEELNEYINRWIKAGWDLFQMDVNPNIPSKVLITFRHSL